MKIACLSFTDSGELIGERLKKSKNYEINHIRNKSIEGGIKTIVHDLWANYDCLVFISATGIACRFIASYIKDKNQDPAVLVIDDLGRFSISLLSGHIGGANELAEKLGELIGALPVITTASDARGFQSLDLFAKENNYYIENMKSITKLTALMVNKKKIGFYTSVNKISDYTNLVLIEDLEDLNKPQVDGLIMVSHQLSVEDLIQGQKPYGLLRPKVINIGIGCRKGVSADRIIRAIGEALETNDLSPNSIKSIGTIEVKKNEQGLIEAGEYYNRELKIFTIDEIRKVEDRFKKSLFVKKSVGVYSVSEPCAYLLGGKFILRKAIYDGITISITKEERHG